MKLIEMIDVSRSFGEGELKIEALKTTNISIKAGEFVAVIGPSGSGKSTFLTITGGLQTPSSGKVLINGKPFSEVTEKKRAKLRFEEIGFILQASNLVPFLTVQDQLHLANKVERSKVDKQKRDELLKELGIFELKDKFPSDLSGGQSSVLPSPVPFTMTHQSYLLTNRPPVWTHRRHSKWLKFLPEKQN